MESSHLFSRLPTVEPTSLERSTEKPYIIIVGGLRLKKGADYVLAVAKQLQDRRSDLQILVAGESETIYSDAAKKYPNITLLGTISDLDLPNLVRGASSSLFLSHYEGFGIPPLEAMAAGVPAVVSDRASLPEVVGDAGIVVDPNDAVAIAEILVDLDRSPQLRADYISRGRERAATYTWDKCVDRVVDTLNKFA